MTLMTADARTCRRQCDPLGTLRSTRGVIRRGVIGRPAGQGELAVTEDASVRSPFPTLNHLTYRRVTTKHVYDLAWSPDGEFFIAGSTDNTATIWKASSGRLWNEVLDMVDENRGMRVRAERALSQRTRRFLGPAERIHRDTEQ